MRDLPFFIFPVILILIVVGWVLNIVQLFNLQEFTGETVLRAVGIVLAPLGAVLGYL